MIRKHTNETFIQKSIEKHGNKYDYSKVRFVTSDEKVSIGCPIHGYFEQKASNHCNNGYGCNECSKVKRGRAKTLTNKSQKEDFSHVVLPPNERLIPLTRGKYAIVSVEDFELLDKYNWNAYKGVDGRYYAIAYVEGVCVRMHRFLLGLKHRDGIYADHKDGDGLRNTRDNIRVCTPQENSYNQRLQSRSKTSKYKGVSWSKNYKKWHSYIRQNQKRINIGWFESEDIAAKAYDEKALELFGQFANLNFPND